MIDLLRKLIPFILSLCVIIIIIWGIQFIGNSLLERYSLISLAIIALFIYWIHVFNNVS